MKIYFSGSIRGGRQDASLYGRLISELSNYGKVLTEHIGASELTNELSDRAIHDRDMNWLSDADVLIAEVTVPSHGVGYEIGHAVAQNKKVYCLYRRQKKKSVSAMIIGSPTVTCYEYNGIEDAKKTFAKIFADL